MIYAQIKDLLRKKKVPVSDDASPSSGASTIFRRPSQHSTSPPPLSFIDSDSHKKEHKHHHFTFRRHSRDSNHSFKETGKRFFGALTGSGTGKTGNRDSPVTTSATDELGIDLEDQENHSEASTLRFLSASPIVASARSMPMLGTASMDTSSPPRDIEGNDSIITDNPPPSAGSGRARIIKPGIAALVERFEEGEAAHSSNVPSPINPDDHRRPDSSRASGSTIPSLGLRQFKSKTEADLSQTLQEPKLLPSASPLKPKTNVLRSIASISELVSLRRRDSHRESRGKARRISDARRHCIDEEQSRGWQDKIRALKTWADQCITTGIMEDFDVTVLGCEDISDSSAMLSAEQDLLECCRGRLHITAIAASQLLEALQDSSSQSEHLGKAYEGVLYVFNHPARIALALRIQAAHRLVELNQSCTPCANVLLLAWEWCHHLRADAFMVEFKNKTLSLWSEKVGDLARLPSLETKAPPYGYENVIKGVHGSKL